MEKLLLHGLYAVLDDEAHIAGIDTLTSEVVNSIADVLLGNLHSLNSCHVLLPGGEVGRHLGLDLTG